VQIVCRDRFPDYIEGIRQGAPSAIQITDRWHLLRNLSDAILRMCNGLGRELQEAANLLAMEEGGIDIKVDDVPPGVSPTTVSPQEKLLQDVKELARQGYSNRQIAKMLPIHRQTVARYKVADRVPVKGGQKKDHIAKPFEQFLLQRWQEGCHSPKQLFLEMKANGFEGSMSSS
jgi:hypothetical protein